MQKLILSGITLLSLTLVQAQQNQGKIVYERTTQMQVRLAGNEEMERLMPKSRTDKFELIFGNSKSIWKAVPREEDDDVMTGGEGGGMQIRIVAAGSNDVLYSDFSSSKKVEQRELMDKKFIIDDSIRPLKWKMTGETRSILNFPCMKATATNITTRSSMTNENGKMERKDFQDTALIVAWFTTSIPVSTGPGEYQGQLPGAILEMDVSNGRQVFKAVEVSANADLTQIKEPTGKKHYTPEEFRKERDKMMQEMQWNQGGGQRTIRMN